MCTKTTKLFTTTENGSWINIVAPSDEEVSLIAEGATTVPPVAGN
ncbi:hypothetical protein Q604_UNBC17632G0001, partial [human gut metagenome]